jgi:hypothetical protein
MACRRQRTSAYRLEILSRRVGQRRVTHVSSVSVDMRRRLYHFLRADQLTGNDAGESSLFSVPAAERGVLISASSSMFVELPPAVFRSRLTEPDDSIEAA